MMCRIAYQKNNYLPREKLASLIPNMYVNSMFIGGQLEVSGLVKAICAGFASRTLPSVCNKEEMPMGGTVNSTMPTDMPTMDNLMSPVPSIPKFPSHQVNDFHPV